MSADQTEAIKEAIQVVVTWSQLASVLEAIIGFKPKETFKTAAVGTGLCFRNQPRVEALKEHVRCSRMMNAMSPIEFDHTVHKMNGVTSSYELCDVLILVISRFAEMLGKMAESQASDGGADGSAHGKRYTTMEETRAERINRQALAEEQERVHGLIGGSDMLGMSAKMGGGLPKPSPPPLPPSVDSGRAGKRNVALPPKLEQLRNVMRSSVVSIVRRGLDTNLDSKMVSEPLRDLTLRTIEDKCVTVAGLAKVLLVLLHPRISQDVKMDAMPSAGLAFRATDTDALTRGEQRLLRAVIKQYCKKRWTSTDKDGALRAADAATTKRDVVEILIVLLNQGAKGLGNGPGRSGLPALNNSGTKVVTSDQWAHSSLNSSTNTSKKRITMKKKGARGDMFYSPNGTTARNGRKSPAEMAAAAAAEQLQQQQQIPTPPPQPPSGGLRSKSGGRRRGHGLSAVRSLDARQRPQDGAPPRPLGSYLGVRTLWKETTESN